VTIKQVTIKQVTINQSLKTYITVFHSFINSLNILAFHQSVSQVRSVSRVRSGSQSVGQVRSGRSVSQVRSGHTRQIDITINHISIHLFIQSINQKNIQPGIHPNNSHTNQSSITIIQSSNL